MADTTHNTSAEDDLFPTETKGLPEARATATVPLADGGVLPLHIGPVRKSIAGTPLRMLAYNGSIPGPLLRVQQGTTVTVEVTNDAGLEQTVHWHGLRLDNRSDGVPYETQQPIATGGHYRCDLQFPDPGLYWYHPHMREDYAQEMGLYGQIIVDPASPDYWSPVNQDIALTLDDLLLEDGHIPAFHRSGPTHTMMGRFGTVLLINGETEATFPVTRGEVVRLYLTNTANTRVFNVAVTGAPMKLVGGDSGRYEREELVESVLLSPSERAIVDVLFDRSGAAVLEHRTPDTSSMLATFNVADGDAEPSFIDAFRVLRTDPELEAERAGLAAHLDRTPDKTLQFLGEMDMSGMDMGSMDMSGMDMAGMDMGGMNMSGMGLGSADMSSGRPGDAEGMQDQDMQHLDHPSGPAGVHGHESHDEGAHSMHQTTDDNGIEWEDTMPEMNLMSNLSNMTWKILDTASGAVNDEISWRLQVGDRLKIRLDNSAGSDHQMHHPFHIHGAGRFLVLDRGGVPEPNLVWKDTVLIRAGEVVNILFDVTNPGRWMAHCHIAEHIESRMMFSFDVLETATAEETP
ncbi:MAG TPA: multicopper oxidase family protein [Propionibacteriaceae bacterium]|nr:multicopper oxidase family protein [Propionibacteriaceae bacterium]